MKNSTSLIANVQNLEEARKVTTDEEVKYINIDIEKATIELLIYLEENGSRFLYSDKIRDKIGYIYSTFEDYKRAVKIIKEIIQNINETQLPIEKARYIYIALGERIKYNINNNPEKNEEASIDNQWQTVNPFSAISTSNVNEKSTNKLFTLLCTLVGLQPTLIDNGEEEFVELNLDDKLKINLFKDLPNIYAKFKTKYFGRHNNIPEIDKKINYIKATYNDEILEQRLKEETPSLSLILQVLPTVLNIKNIPPVYQKDVLIEIISKYLPNEKINITTYYYKRKERLPFIIIEEEKKYYSYNYQSNTFTTYDENSLKNTIKNGIIGIYKNEILEDIDERKKNKWINSN